MYIGVTNKGEGIVQNPAKPDLHQLPTTALPFNWTIFIIGLAMLLIGWYNVYKK